MSRTEALPLEEEGSDEVLQRWCHRRHNLLMQMDDVLEELHMLTSLDAIMHEPEDEGGEPVGRSRALAEIQRTLIEAVSLIERLDP